MLPFTSTARVPVVPSSQIPVVVVSGSISEADEARVAELGAVAFLRKPVDPQTLHETLARAAGQTAGPTSDS